MNEEAKQAEPGGGVLQVPAVWPWALGRSPAEAQFAGHPVNMCCDPVGTHADDVHFVVRAYARRRWLRQAHRERRVSRAILHESCAPTVKAHERFVDSHGAPGGESPWPVEDTPTSFLLGAPDRARPRAPPERGLSPARVPGSAVGARPPRASTGGAAAGPEFDLCGCARDLLRCRRPRRLWPAQTQRRGPRGERPGQGANAEAPPPAGRPRPSDGAPRGPPCARPAGPASRPFASPAPRRRSVGSRPAPTRTAPRARR